MHKLNIKRTSRINRTGGPYGDFLVDKISNSPAPVKESLIVPPLHRTVKDGHVEPWKKFDEEQFAVEQKRKLRWESFVISTIFLQENLAQTTGASMRYATKIWSMAVILQEVLSHIKH